MRKLHSVYTNGANIEPVLQADGYYRWVVTSFEDSTFNWDGEICPIEESVDYNGVIYDDWDEDVTDEILDEGEDNEN